VALRLRRDHLVVKNQAGRQGWWTTTLAVLAVVVVLPVTIFLVSAWLKGWQVQAVQSGSMAPTYPVGSLLVVEPIDASQVKSGMALVFEDPQITGRIVTHRVVSRAPGDTLQFWTQGDANAFRDPFPVPARLVRGRVLWHVDYLGSLMTYLRWPRSFLLLVVFPGLLLVVSVWRGRQKAASAQRGAGEGPEVAVRHGDAGDESGSALGT
jgi:signal peptidase